MRRPSLSAARGGTTAIVIGVQSRTADFKETERYAQPGGEAWCGRHHLYRSARQ